eukprot:SAG22_NODE_655_length_8104_cov_6.498438_9_plen_590_part_00
MRTKALPLPCVSTVFLSKTAPFLAVRLHCRLSQRLEAAELETRECRARAAAAEQEADSLARELAEVRGAGQQQPPPAPLAVADRDRRLRPEHRAAAAPFVEYAEEEAEEEEEEEADRAAIDQESRPGRRQPQRQAKLQYEDELHHHQHRRHQHQHRERQAEPPQQSSRPPPAWAGATPPIGTWAGAGDADNPAGMARGAGNGGANDDRLLSPAGGRPPRAEVGGWEPEEPLPAQQHEHGRHDSGGRTQPQHGGSDDDDVVSRWRRPATDERLLASLDGTSDTVGGGEATSSGRRAAERQAAGRQAAGRALRQPTTSSSRAADSVGDLLRHAVPHAGSRSAESLWAPGVPAAAAQPAAPAAAAAAPARRSVGRRVPEAAGFDKRRAQPSVAASDLMVDEQQQQPLHRLPPDPQHRCARKIGLWPAAREELLCCCRDSPVHAAPPAALAPACDCDCDRVVALPWPACQAAGAGAAVRPRAGVGAAAACSDVARCRGGSGGSDGGGVAGVGCRLADAGPAKARRRRPVRSRAAWPAAPCSARPGTAAARPHRWDGPRPGARRARLGAVRHRGFASRAAGHRGARGEVHGALR